VKVYCDFALNATCIYPNKSKVRLEMIAMYSRNITVDLRRTGFKTIYDVLGHPELKTSK